MAKQPIAVGDTGDEAYQRAIEEMEEHAGIISAANTQAANSRRDSRRSLTRRRRTLVQDE